MIKPIQACLTLIISTAIISSTMLSCTALAAQEDAPVGGIGGTGAQEETPVGIGGIGGTGIRDMERPELLERPEILENFTDAIETAGEVSDDMPSLEEIPEP